jgi:hypothetical protein
VHERLLQQYHRLVTAAVGRYSETRAFMPASMHIEIAGIQFVLHCRDATLLPDSGSCYDSFLTPSAADRGTIRVDLDMVIGGLPDLRGSELLFDGQSWALYRDGDGYFIALASRAPDVPPAWIARIDSSYTRGTVFCDELLVSDKDGARSLVNPVLNRLDQLLLMFILARREGALIHSAGAVVGGSGFVFAGRSGAGKSTISRQFQAAGTAPLLSDDRIVVRKIAGIYSAYGTPWAGDAQIALNRGAPLGALLFLHHGHANRVERVSPRDAFEKLLPMVSVPWYDRVAIEQITSFCEALTWEIPSYDLHFVPTAEVAGFLEKTIPR